jgi:DNA-nicking Smr family endonuclease
METLALNRPQLSHTSVLHPKTIDVHHLLVEEAVQETFLALEQVLRADEVKLDIIVGKGLHSKDSIAKLKPGVQTALLS